MDVEQASVNPIYCWRMAYCGGNIMKGIYQYRDLKTDEIVYIGKDSNIDKNVRHRHHMNKHYYNQQVINQVLQNNADRYQYEIIYCGDYDTELLNSLEINSIAEEQPIFNFTIGGDGLSITGWKHSEEAKQKMSESHKGKTPWNKCKKGYFHHSQETKNRISESMKGKQNCLNNELTIDHKLNISKGSNTTGFFRVSKWYNSELKQGFRWGYSYYDGDKRKVISSIDLDKLKEKVLNKGLEWREI